MSDRELLACPFCGGESSLLHEIGNEVWPQNWKAGCKSCGIWTPCKDGSSSWHVVKKQDEAAKAAVIERWNRRAAAAIEGDAMIDRELLERAAKAAGLVVVGLVDEMIVQPPENKRGGLVIRNEHGGDSLWHPGKCDGDALRLAVKLGLFWSPPIHHYLALEDFGFDGVDPYAATRRAIVRAAAAIGGGE